ncbi:MAG: XdhC family protein [Opitutaceae bacterium]|nr:XdhC family protein [Opitutaceae bacterium]
MRELSAIVSALLAPPVGPTVLATLVSAEGSSYRRPGARLLLLADSRRVGSISGGCLEEDVIARATKVRATGVAEVVVYDTTSENDLVWGVGLGCHGVVRVLIERLPPAPAWVQALARSFEKRQPTALSVIHGGEDRGSWGTRLAAPGDCPDSQRLFSETVAPPTALVIFGAGDDAQPLSRLAHELGWQVTVADPRAALATAARFPTAHRFVVGPADALVAQAAPDAATLAVVMTHHYVHDVPLLRDLLARPLAYLGLLGPRQRAEKILADLAAHGRTVTPAQRARLHAPVGLDLGADGPEQVALSMLSEMQATLAGRDARPLRERTRPIHD